MHADKSRAFELTATVTFPTLERSHLESFAAELDAAVLETSSEYPALVAYFVQPNLETGDINVGFRFDGANPKYIEEMVDDILKESVELVANRDGTKPLDVEREESALVLA